MFWPLGERALNSKPFPNRLKVVKDSKALRPGLISITVDTCISREKCLAFGPLTEDKRCLSEHLLWKREKAWFVTPTLFLLKGNYKKDSQSNFCRGQTFSSKPHRAHQSAFSPYILSQISTQFPTLTRQQSPAWNITPADEESHVHSLQPPDMLSSIFPQESNAISCQAVRIPKDDHVPFSGPPC